MGQEEEAISVSCPKCGAKRGEPCTYIPLVEDGRYVTSNKIRARMAIVGTPTKRPHNDRMNRLTDVQRARRRRQRLQTGIASTPAALFALRDFDRREHERLKAWLKENWSIFRLR